MQRNNYALANQHAMYVPSAIERLKSIDDYGKYRKNQLTFRHEFYEDSALQFPSDKGSWHNLSMGDSHK